ncbi:hypothetical protein [Thalassotalea sp. G2M2-11]|uniref:dioxygenase family protein n=1 Tax=Thalassotalea sp. G2M2-11 TaxID=2787627 RepID=UPI0019D01F54|nr:hypothetical protein [Thalassotalea sp. G2M2-11]
MFKTSLFTLFLAFFLNVTYANEPVIGGPCQGCELVFVGMPKQLSTESTIGPANEKGEKMTVNGKVYQLNGMPAKGIVVYAYQTNAEGFYPKSTTKHGGLRGWALTDNKGRYSFSTVRPAAYPKRGIPQHIHLHVIEPNKGTYYIDDVTFNDDPLLTQQYKQSRPCRAGCGFSTPEKNTQGVWTVNRDIFLGKGIPDY